MGKIAMLSCSVPVGVRILADRFKDLFLDECGNYKVLCSMFCYFLFGMEGLSELVRTTSWSPSLSQLSTSVNLFEPSRFMRRMRGSILRKYGGKISFDDFVYAVDDTANPKYGKNIFGASSWHSSKGPFFGQKILVVSLVDINRKIALPLGYTILTKKDDGTYEKAHDSAVRLLVEAEAEGYPHLAVTTDSWFDSAEFMRVLEENGFAFVGEIKANRKVKANPSPFAKWANLQDIFRSKKRQRARSRFDSTKVIKRKIKAKCFAFTRLFIKKRNKALNAIAVYNRRNSKQAFAYYVSTDLSMSGAKIWEITRARWSIECLFRDLKQNLSFGRLPCTGKNASDLAVVIPFILITSLRLDDHTKKWGVKKNLDSIGASVRQIREEHFSQSINKLISIRDQAVISSLKARRNPVRLSQKPAVQAAEAA